MRRRPQVCDTIHVVQKATEDTTGPRNAWATLSVRSDMQKCAGRLTKDAGHHMIFHWYPSHERVPWIELVDEDAKEGGRPIHGTDHCSLAQAEHLLVVQLQGTSPIYRCGREGVVGCVEGLISVWTSCTSKSRLESVSSGAQYTDLTQREGECKPTGLRTDGRS